MKQHLSIIFLIFITIFLNHSCSNERPAPTSAPEMETNDSMSVADSMVTQRDTNVKERIHKENTVAKRSAVFGYSVFKNMRQNETREINAFVSVINPISKVIDTLREINASNIPERRSDTATIIAKNLVLYKSLNIQLYNAGDSNFIIKPFSESSQIIDSLDGNSWSWAVTPRTDKKYATLIMNVVAEKPDGSHEPFSTIQIPITITIDKAINRTLWQWMMDNPEKVITIILIPFIAFFWKQITGLFKKKESTPS